MKTLILSMMLFGTLIASPVFAQSTHKPVKKTIKKEEETIIIKKDDANPQTVIEIKDGSVFVNGDEVASVDKNSSVYKKIIIDDQNDKHEDMANGMPGFGDEPAITRKVMLGVYTATSGEEGAKIEKVMPNTAADNAGLKPGDVIKKINGREVADGRELTDIIANHEVGDKISITYLRKGKQEETEAALTKANPDNSFHSYGFGNPNMRRFEMPNNMRPFWFDASDEPSVSTPKLGIVGEERADGEGVLISEVKDGSAAQKAGLEKNDVITRLNDEKVGSVDDIKDILRRSKKDNIKVAYERNGNSATTVVSIEKQRRKEDF